MTTRNAIVISVSIVLLLVSVALALLSNRNVDLEDGVSRPGSISETGSTTVSSPAFESFLIRSDETPEGSNRPIFFGKHLFEMRATGDIVEIDIPDNKGVLSAQYSPDKGRVLLSLCELEGRKLCGLYLYELENKEMAYLTENEPDSDYAKPVWVSDEDIVYLFNIAGVGEKQKFIPFRAPLSDPSQRTILGEEGEYDCLYIDANSGGEVVVGCRNSVETVTTIIHYNDEGEEVRVYDTEGLVTGVEISENGEIYALLSSDQTSNTTGLVSLEENRIAQERVRSISMFSSDVFAYTESPFENYLIVSDMGNRELIKSPGRILLDSK
jgi:hypothetical protein